MFLLGQLMTQIWKWNLLLFFLLFSAQKKLFLEKGEESQGSCCVFKCLSPHISVCRRDAVGGRAVEGSAAGKEQGRFCAPSSPFCSPPAFQRCFSSPQTIYPMEVAHSITKITQKMSFLPSVWFEFVFFLSEYRIVSSSELDLCVHWGTAQSLLISYGTGKWISHWRGRGFLTKAPSIHLSIFISFISTSLLLNCCSPMLSDRLIFLASDSFLSLLKVPWA